MRRLVCSVVGTKETGSKWSPEVQLQAYKVGFTAVAAGFVVMTGGKSGVMEHAARGAQRAGGIAIGILPEGDREFANPYLTLALPSGMGIGRNVLTALFCDVMVALPGGTGTLEEMAFAVDFERPVLSWGSWDCIPGVVQVENINDVEAWLRGIHAEYLNKQKLLGVEP